MRARITPASAVSAAIGAEPLERKAQRRDVGAAAVDDRDVGHAASQHALAARQFRAFDAQGLAQRAADALEAGLDHVVRVLARAPATWIAAPRLSASERKKCGTSSVGRPPTASRANLPSNTRVRRGRTGRWRPAPALRPSAAGSRSARCRACRRAPRAAPAPSASAQSSTVWCSSISRSPCARELKREAAVPGDLLEHVIEEADAGRDRDRRRSRRGSTATRMSVSLVLRVTRRAMRSAGDSSCAIAGQVSPSLPSSRTRRPWMPRLRASSQVGVAVADHAAVPPVDRRPAQELASAGRCFGLRQSQPSLGGAGRRTPRRTSMPCERTAPA